MSRAMWLKLELICFKGARKEGNVVKVAHTSDARSGDMKEYIDKFFDAVDKLEGMNVQINGDLLTIILLYSLPSSFENFKCAIESRDRLPIAEELEVKILEETEARKNEGELITAYYCFGCEKW